MFPGVLVDQLPVMVAGYLNPILPHQILDGLFGPKRPRNMVAEIDDAIHLSCLDVVHHFFKSGDVSVYIREYRYPLHVLSGWKKADWQIETET